MVTRRRQLQDMWESVDKEKIRKAEQHIFEYLDKEGFNLIETQYLLSSMGNILNNMKKNDPLRKIKNFDYSSSIEEVLTSNAISNTES